MAKRPRRFGSVADELVKKAREAMLTAVQIFNNPQIEFKSELFIVTTVVACTYLLHAFYRKSGVEYRRLDNRAKRRRYLKTKFGATWHWSLEDCLNAKECPLEEIVKKNLTFLVEIRHEIEHQMTRRIDDQISAKFQASALNFNQAIKKWFGTKHGLDAEQAFSIQFSGIGESDAKELMKLKDLPQNIHSFIIDYEKRLSDTEFNDPRFAYRVAFVRKITNSKSAADQVVEFVAAGTEKEVALNQVFLKEIEKKKYRPKTIIDQMNAEGFKSFKQHQHTELWKAMDARNSAKNFGVMVEGTWFWYANWFEEVRRHCVEKYGPGVLKDDTAAA